MIEHVSAAASRIAGLLQNRKPKFSEATFVRPANTTAYAIGDVIYPDVPADLPDPDVAPPQIKALTFANAVADPGAALILTARLIDYAAEATQLNASLYLFDEVLGTAPVDNAAFAPTAADMANFVGVISFSNSIAKTVSAHSIYQVVPNMVVQSAATSNNLYGVLIADNAYAPLSAERFTIQLGTIPQDLAIF